MSLNTTPPFLADISTRPRSHDQDPRYGARRNGAGPPGNSQPRSQPPGLLNDWVTAFANAGCDMNLAVLFADRLHSIPCNQAEIDELRAEELFGLGVSSGYVNKITQALKQIYPRAEGRPQGRGPENSTRVNLRGQASWLTEDVSRHVDEPLSFRSPLPPNGPAHHEPQRAINPSSRQADAYSSPWVPSVHSPTGITSSPAQLTPSDESIIAFPTPGVDDFIHGSLPPAGPEPSVSRRSAESRHTNGPYFPAPYANREQAGYIVANGVRLRFGDQIPTQGNNQRDARTPHAVYPSEFEHEPRVSNADPYVDHHQHWTPASSAQPWHRRDEGYFMPENGAGLPRTTALQRATMPSPRRDIEPPTADPLGHESGNLTLSRNSASATIPPTGYNEEYFSTFYNSSNQATNANQGDAEERVVGLASAAVPRTQTERIPLISRTLSAQAPANERREPENPSRSLPNPLVSSVSLTQASTSSSSTRLLDIFSSSSGATLTYTISRFSEDLRKDQASAGVWISSLSRRKETSSVRHEFVVFRVVASGGSDFYVRLDRAAKKDYKKFRLRSVSSIFPANDTVLVSSKEGQLLDPECKSEVVAYVEFPGEQPTLLSLARVLDILGEESPEYHLMSENCYFFSSALQEIFCERLGGRLIWGGLDHKKLGRSIRDHAMNRI